jgi:hypothetical protein
MAVTLATAARAENAPARAPAEGDATTPHEEHALVTDRPGATDSSEVVGKGHLHFEGGLDAERFKDEQGTRVDGFRTPFELRFGLLEELEVALLGDGFAHDRLRPEDAPSEGHAGFGDLAVRLRYHFLDRGGKEHREVPSAAILVDLELPTGTVIYRDHGVSSAVKLAFDWPLPADFGLSVNLGVIVPHDVNGSRFAQLHAAFNLSRPLTPLTDRVGVYFSIGSFVPDIDRTHNRVVVDTGVVAFPVAALQLDVEALFGLTDQGPDIGFGLGLCYRFF